MFYVALATGVYDTSWSISFLRLSNISKGFGSIFDILPTDRRSFAKTPLYDFPRHGEEINRPDVVHDVKRKILLIHCLLTKRKNNLDENPIISSPFYALRFMELIDWTNKRHSGRNRVHRKLS